MIAKPPPSRKTRTKLRKPKFASLRLHLSAAATTTTTPPPMTTAGEHKQLINLFPLHPENLVEQLQYNFCDDKSATTLTGILTSDDEEEQTININGNINNPSPLPASVNYDDREVEQELVRTAMRGKKGEWNGDDGKWVCYSEVVERKESSSEGSCGCWYEDGDRNRNRSNKLVLKLDYEKIMKTWVDKGPFCGGGAESGLDAPTPQTVPDGLDEELGLPSSGTRYDEQEYGGNGGSWMVPEMTHTENNEIRKGDDTLQAGESSAMTHNREASVQRYKEKRRNRLFAKTIRYEVRKLNAEKRPRIKGRFVKRN